MNISVEEYKIAEKTKHPIIIKTLRKVEKKNNFFNIIGDVNNDYYG